MWHECSLFTATFVRATCADGLPNTSSALMFKLQSAAFVATNLASFAHLAHASEPTCFLTNAHVAAWRAASFWSLVRTA